MFSSECSIDSIAVPPIHPFSSPSIRVKRLLNRGQTHASPGQLLLTESPRHNSSVLFPGFALLIPVVSERQR
jgi:hypothetical protein